MELLESKILRFFYLAVYLTLAGFGLHSLPVPSSIRIPSGLNTILTGGLKDDLKSLEAANYSLRKGHLKELGLHHAPRPAHFGISPEELGRIPGAGLVAGWELGNHEEVSAD